MWNISLHYEDSKQVQKVIKRSMNRNCISFYDLDILVHEVGFSSLDFLYYKKKGRHGREYLVLIDGDHNVTNMISECEAEKSVNLYLFKERAKNDIAPSDSSVANDVPITGLEDDDCFTEAARESTIRKPQGTLNFYLNFYFIWPINIRMSNVVHFIFA